jgi:hypothetical protein
MEKGFRKSIFNTFAEATDTKKGMQTETYKEREKREKKLKFESDLAKITL